MKNDLFIEVEKLLDNEALRILPIVIDSYYSTNKLITAEIKGEVNVDFKYFSTEIELRVYYFIKLKDNDSGIEMEDRYEDNKNYLYNYYDYCVGNGLEKDHKVVAEDIRKKYLNSNNFSSLEVMKLVIELMPVYFKEHYDSVDVRTVILFL